MSKSTTSLSRNQSQMEELANSISHGLALVAIVVGTPFLVVSALITGSLGTLFGNLVFSITAMLLYHKLYDLPCINAGQNKRYFSGHRSFGDISTYCGHLYALHPWGAQRHMGLDAVWNCLEHRSGRHCAKSFSRYIPPPYLYRTLSIDGLANRFCH